MDKNRPLPPGTAFDEYKPLYGSNVPTPEATPEQQKERLILGGW